MVTERIVQPWTEEALQCLLTAWKSDRSYKEQMHLFPGRSYESVRKEARYRYGPKPVRYARPEAISLILIRKLLEGSEPMTAKAISEKINVTCRSVMYTLKSNSGTQFHVAGYEECGRNKSKLWAAGAGDEASRPAPKSNRELKRRCRQRAREKKLLAGAPVRSVNPFMTASGLVAVPEGPRGRVFQQSMNLKDFDEDLEAA